MTDMPDVFELIATIKDIMCSAADGGCPQCSRIHTYVDGLLAARFEEDAPDQPAAHAGSVWACEHPECNIESTCGDCIDGRCHESGPCGCARHEASVQARQRHAEAATR